MSKCGILKQSSTSFTVHGKPHVERQGRTVSAEEFAELLKTRPFVPLRIHLTDGTTSEIHHPELVLVLRSRLDIGVPADRTTGVLDRVEHCSLLHIVRVEELNGGHRSNHE